MQFPKVAVLGCGYWGRNLVRNFRSLGALELVCDPAPAGLAAAREIAPDVAVCARFEEALEHPRIQAIALATPAETHHALALAALRRGKDVFVEKPLALSVGSGRELCAEAAQRGRILMVGHLLRYHPCVEKMLAMVALGEVGRLQYITSNRLNLGKIRREENALWSFAPHDLSVILALAGGQLPEHVRCVGEAWLTPGIADTTLTTLKFAAGLRAHVYVSWLNPFKEQKLTVVGSQGMLVFDDTRPWKEKLSLHPQPVTWVNGQDPKPSKGPGEPVVVPESEPLLEECRHFLESCSHRRPPRTDGSEGLRVLEVLNAAQQSLDRDGEIAIPASLVPGPTSEPARPATPPGTQPTSAPPEWFGHATAIVDDGAKIGKGSKIWHYSHVSSGAQLGERCNLGQNVFVASGVSLGNNVKIQNNVSIYTGTEIEDDVFLGPSCVLTNVTNPRSQVNRHSLYEKTVIRRGATIGANATIVCGTTIGQYAFVAAGAVVTRDVPDYALMLGNPARPSGWMSRHGHRLRNPDTDGLFRCPESGFRYRETSPGVLRCLDLDETAALPAALAQGQRTYEDFKAAAPHRSPSR